MGRGKREEDNSSFVGTCFEEEEDGSVSGKTTQIWNQTATDDQGRRRFHGAFTGGFSAGYFNTVGSKEGWTPQEFKSSRKDKLKKDGDMPQTRRQQTIEDFMDEEDLAADVRTTKTYDRDLHAGTRIATEKYDTEEDTSGLARAILPQSSLVPPKESVGERLLRVMGWRRGHGIGARLRVHKRERKRKYDGETAALAGGKRRKVYGLQLDLDELRRSEEELPAPHEQDVDARLRKRTAEREAQTALRVRRKKWDVKGEHAAQKDVSMSVSSVPPRKPSIIDEWRDTVAPQEVGVVSFRAKTNSFGIGFNPYSLDPETQALVLSQLGDGKGEVARLSMKDGEISANSTASAKRIGLGVFEDSDDIEVYDTTQQSKQYFHELPSSIPSAHDRAEEVTRRASSLKRQSGQKCADSRLVLVGFLLCDTITYEMPSDFVLPMVPSSFKERHVFDKALHTATEVDRRSLNADRRGQMVGARQLPAAKPESVFDLLSPEDRAKLKAATGKGLTADTSAGKEKGMMNLNPAMAYFDNPEKQRRYKAFLMNEPRNNLGLSTQQIEAEEAEFSRAADAFKSIPEVMQSRFTRPKNDDVGGTENDDVRRLGEKGYLEDETHRPQPEAPTDDVVRVSVDWVPERLLCKRFDVQYPWTERIPDLRADVAAEQRKREGRVVVPATISPTAQAIKFTPTTMTQKPSPLSTTVEREEEDDDAVAAPDLPPETRPSMDLFKLIFEDNKDAEESSDEEESSEEE